MHHNVSILTSCNYGMAAFWYRTNSMLVINEIDNEDTPNAIEALESNLDGDGKEDECEKFSTPEADGFEPFDSNENTEE